MLIFLFVLKNNLCTICHALRQAAFLTRKKKFSTAHEQIAAATHRGRQTNGEADREGGESRRENKSKNQSSGTLTQQTFFFFTMSGKSAQRMLANRRAREDELYSAEIKLREDQNLSALG